MEEMQEMYRESKTVATNLENSIEGSVAVQCEGEV